MDTYGRSDHAAHSCSRGPHYLQLDRLDSIGAVGVVAGLQDAAEGKQNATAVEAAAVSEQETDNLYEEDTADRPVLPGDNSGLAVEDRNEGAR